MSAEHRIEKIEKPEDGAWGIIGRGLSAFNVDQAGDDHFLHRPLGRILLRIVGGLLVGGKQQWHGGQQRGKNVSFCSHFTDLIVRDPVKL